MHLSEHDNKCRPHNMRTLIDPSLISFGHRIPLLNIANDANEGECQSHTSCASKQTHISEPVTSYL